MIPPNNANQNQGGQPQNPGSTPPPTPPYSPLTPVKKPSNVFLPVAIAIGFIMLVAAAFLTYSSINTTRNLETKVAELEEAEKLRTELESQFNQAIAELDQMKGDNEQINALIEQQKLELEGQKDRITELLKEKKKLDAARAEISNLRARVQEYVAQVQQLQAENEQLAASNTTLKEETTVLNETLQAKGMENENLSQAKAQLVNDKEELTKAVQAGSVVKVKEVKVTGMKTSKSGKTKEKDNAKRVDQLKVCFTTVANDIVQPGNEKFFIRIINPAGETLAIDDLGDGAVLNSKTGEEISYTKVQEYNYMNDETQLCFMYQPDMPFKSGKYKVEIYNKGYIAGTGGFELK